MTGVQAAGVQCTGEQYPVRARPIQALQVGLVTHPTGGKELAAIAPVHGVAHQFHFRSAAAADTAKGHHDDPLRPQIGGSVQSRRPDEPTLAKIEGQYGSAAMIAGDLPQQARIGERLASQYGRAEFLLLKTPVVVPAADARVHPKLQGRVPSVQASNDIQIVAGTCNGVQVGDIQRAKGVQSNKSIGHRERIAIGAQRSTQCTVA